MLMTRFEVIAAIMLEKYAGVHSVFWMFLLARYAGCRSAWCDRRLSFILPKPGVVQ